MNRQTAILILLFGIAYTQALLTCSERPFCNQVRNKINPQNHFTVGGISVTPGGILTGDLRDSENSKTFKLEIASLANDVFRIRVTDPTRNRHSFDDALDGTPASATKRVTTSRKPKAVSITNGLSELIVHEEPFSIDVTYDGRLIQQLNSDGRMEYISEDNNQVLSMDVKFPGAQRAFGLPEHADGLSLTSTGPDIGEPYRLYNMDVPAYATDSRDALYGSVPILYGVSTSSTSGLLWLTSSQTYVDIAKPGLDNIEALFISETGVMDVFVLPGPTLKDSVRRYAHLTGTAELPPYFSLGYHQSRWSYMSQDDVETVVAEMDNHNFPLDVMWLDIDYADNIKYFTWNLNTFPNPLGMQDKLKAMGRKLVVIIDPHIKVEDGYFVFEQGQENRYFITNPNGTDYHGHCWPGLSAWIDFTNPDAMKWYSSLYDSFEGISDIVHIWNDMNEPAVFEPSDVEKTMHPDLIHHDGWQHRDVHSAYAFYQTKGTFEGLQSRFPGRRNFILTRAHSVGSQRYTAMWTGDNVASWEHLRVSISICLTESLAGISFCGADVGGFVGSVTHELFQRWYQLGAWLPFYRSHTAQEVERREPYLYPEDVQARFRNAMRQRYQHLPYWYTLWFEHTINKDPVIRPVSFNYPNNYLFLDTEFQFMVGDNIYVCPVLSANVIEQGHQFPGPEDWFDATNNLMYKGGQFYSYPITMDSTPVFYRSGSIVPLKETIRSSSVQTHNDPYTLYVFLDRNYVAKGNLYLDDYTTFDYKSKKYLYIQFTYDDNRITWEKLHADADYAGVWQVSHTLVYRPPSALKRARFVSGDEVKPVTVEYGPDDFYARLSGFSMDLRKPGYVEFY